MILFFRVTFLDYLMLNCKESDYYVQKDEFIQFKKVIFRIEQTIVT